MAGIIGTAIISLVVTGVVPSALGQIFDAAKIKDAIRPGSDINITESLYDPDGNGPGGSAVVRPFVVPGKYSPSSRVVHELSRKTRRGMHSNESD